jgi:hypothetical protein
MREEYLRKEDKLREKKKRAYAEGRITNWEIRPEDMASVDQVKLRKDEAFALPLMFAKVSLIFYLVGNTRTSGCKCSSRILYQ